MLCTFKRAQGLAQLAGGTRVVANAEAWTLYEKVAVLPMHAYSKFAF